MKMHLLASLAFAAALPAVPALADDAMTPSAVLDRAATVDGTKVTVSGTVQKYQLRDTPVGQITTFALCSDDKKCVGVFETKADQRTDGTSATVTGTFHTSYVFHGHTISKVIVLDQ